ncbi:hypothetical protein AMECASPLE_037787 [Ameca splendens]|uniref:V-type proton ATPase subunit C n=1 Tax=Ameca splendens TaxID=208324 RepID=A0ABV0XL19_9TELE
MEPPGDKVQEYALANGDHRMNQRSAAPSPLKTYLTSLRVDLINYVTKFQWDKAKYPTALPLSTLTDLINKGLSKKPNKALQIQTKVQIQKDLQEWFCRKHGKTQHKYVG